MLDMSKAFDTIQRGYLFDDLKHILDPDELYLIHLLLDNVEIAVKLENELGELFKSLKGSPQGDAASRYTMRICGHYAVPNGGLRPVRCAHW